MESPDLLPVNDPIWADAYLIGGESRVAQLAIASLQDLGRLRKVQDMFLVERGAMLDATQTMQRLVLNVLHLDEFATAKSIAPTLRKTEPIRNIRRNLSSRGLIWAFPKWLGGAFLRTPAGKRAASRLVSEHAGTTGVRAVAYGS